MITINTGGSLYAALTDVGELTLGVDAHTCERGVTYETHSQVRLECNIRIVRTDAGQKTPAQYRGAAI